MMLLDVFLTIKEVNQLEFSKSVLGRLTLDICMIYIDGDFYGLQGLNRHIVPILLKSLRITQNAVRAELQQLSDYCFRRILE